MKNQDNRTEQFRNDPRSTDEIIRRVLALDPDADDDRYWKMIFVLQHRVPEIFMLLQEMCVDTSEKVRDTAATVLGQSGVEKKQEAGRAADLLIDRLGKEPSLMVLESIVFSLGHLESPRKISALAALVDHPNPQIRYALSHSVSQPDDPEALRVLIKLSRDTDEDVRNWATFSIGSETELDTPELREALAARVKDPHGETRMEAVVGLVQRGDARAVATLLRELDEFGSGREDREYQEGLVLDALDAAMHRLATEKDEIWRPVIDKAKKLGVLDAETPAD